MSSVVWKGSIAFGLVHLPVSIHSAAGTKELNLDLLDRRDFSPVGYQRINKRTGEPVEPQDIVKGYRYEDDEYVIVSDEDLRQANVRASRVIDIHGFVLAEEIPPFYFDTPYYLEPGEGGSKGYGLLRETLRRTGRVGLATVVIRTRQRLASIMPMDNGLLLNTLRFAEEIRPVEKLNLPEGDAKQLGLSATELDMATRLVDDMSEEWSPEQYHDTYREDLMAVIRQKIQAGRTHVVTEPVEEVPAYNPEVVAQVADLMDMLKRSLAVARPPARRGTPQGRSSGTRGGRAKPSNEPRR